MRYFIIVPLFYNVIIVRTASRVSFHRWSQLAEFKLRGTRRLTRVDDTNLTRSYNIYARHSSYDVKANVTPGRLLSILTLLADFVSRIKGADDEEQASIATDFNRCARSSNVSSFEHHH